MEIELGAQSCARERCAAPVEAIRVERGPSGVYTHIRLVPLCADHDAAYALDEVGFRYLGSFAWMNA